MLSSVKKGNILGTSVAVLTQEQAVENVLLLAMSGSPAYVCFSTAHMLVEAAQNKNLRAAYDNADLVTADGRPVCWGLRISGNPEADCVSGPLLVPKLLAAASRERLKVGFYGGRPETLERMLTALENDYPNLDVVYQCSPPFRPLSNEEHAAVRSAIKMSGAQLLFVGLGSPKQELWMAANSADLPCVLLGVGAVFEFLSGEKFLPPEWIQKLGLTWFIRLCQEPRRLLRRNLVYSPLFVLRFLKQYMFASGRTQAMSSQVER